MVRVVSERTPPVRWHFAYQRYLIASFYLHIHTVLSAEDLDLISSTCRLKEEERLRSCGWGRTPTVRRSVEAIHFRPPTPTMVCHNFSRQHTIFRATRGVDCSRYLPALTLARVSSPPVSNEARPHRPRARAAPAALCNDVSTNAHSGLHTPV